MENINFDNKGVSGIVSRDNIAAIGNERKAAVKTPEPETIILAGYVFPRKLPLRCSTASTLQHHVCAKIAK